MYDRLLNYLVFKILFVGAVLEPDLKELVVWATWFSLIGFLRVFSMLARDRFEYLTFSPTTPLRTHVCNFALEWSARLPAILRSTLLRTSVRNVALE